MINIFGVGQDIQSIRQYISNRGIQYPNRYRVDFFPSSGLKELADIEDSYMYPASINLPEQTIANLEDYYYTTPRSIPTHIETGMVLMNFIIMQDWKERVYFEKWMHTISYGKFDNYPGIDSVGAVSYNIASSCAMRISLLDGKSPAQPNAVYTYIECYPIQLAPVEFDSTIGGYASFQVGFVVRSQKIWPKGKTERRRRPQESSKSE